MIVRELAPWLILIPLLRVSPVHQSLRELPNTEKSWRISSVELAGNKELDTTSLLSALQTTHAGRWVSDSSLASDIELNLRPVLKKHGFWEGEVSSKVLHDRNPEIRVLIKISEGPRYHVGAIRIQSRTLLEKEDITPFFAIKPGDVANIEEMQKGVETAKHSIRLLEIYYMPSYYIKQSNRTVDVIFTFYENAPRYVAYVSFVGCNDRSQEDRLRRALSIRAGDVFLQSALNSGIAAINGLGLFEKIRENDYSISPVEKEDQSLLGITIFLRPKR